MHIFALFYVTKSCIGVHFWWLTAWCPLLWNDALWPF